MKPPAPDKAQVRSILRRVLTQPTAPFHEHRVRAALAELLREAGLRPAVDRAGNLSARYRRGSARAIAYSAHMDHPGLEIISVAGRRAEARWNGQVPTFDLRGRNMRLWRDGGPGFLGRARVLRGDGRPRKSGGKSFSGKALPASDSLTLSVPTGTQAGDFGYADLPALQFADGRIVSKALDNVGGCCAIAAALIHLARHKLPGDVLGLFTRAEEVGFHGAMAAIRLGTAPQTRPMVVLECSKELPGAVMGRGPVLRVGDRARVFDADLMSALEAASAELKEEIPGLLWQRRLMDGGTCEATAFSLYGYRAVCLAFPLGNYHNVGPRGIAPEFIAESDLLNGVSLLTGWAGRLRSPAEASAALKTRLDARFTRKEMTRLEATV